MLQRIFVRVASYRDPECERTLLDLFEKARHPERIRVGVCHQYAPHRDSPNLNVGPWQSQVLVQRVRAAQSRGVCWARAQTEALLRDEEYSLQIDSHSRFVPGYDELLIEMLEACPSERPVLSAAPASYEPPDRLESDPAPTIRFADHFDAEGNLRCRGRGARGEWSVPRRGAFLAAGFVFSRAALVREVPYDPELYFPHEESAYALRLFTRGWDLFAPPRVTIYHAYRNTKEETRPLHWRDHPEWREFQERGQRRYDQLVGRRSGAPLGCYGLGAERSLAEFEQFSGVSFRSLKIEQRQEFGESSGLAAAGAASSPEEWAPVSATAEDPVMYRVQVAWSAPRWGLWDRVPSFSLPDVQGHEQNFQRQGGQRTLLVVVPRPSEELRSELLEAVRAARLGSDVAEVWVLLGVSGDVARRQGWGDLSGTVLCDPRREWLCRWGDEEPVVFSIDPGLQIEGVFQHRSLAQGFRQARLFAHRAPRGIRVSPAVHAPVLHVTNVFSEDERAQLLEMFEWGETFPGRVGARGGRYDPRIKIREDSLLGRHACSFVDEHLIRRVLPEIHKAFGFEVTYREPYKIARYHAGQAGFFRRHRDNVDPDLAYRAFALSVNLNDGYEGGELSFPEYGNTKYRMKAGEGLVFSCSLVHEVSPLRRGQRTILLGFLAGESAREQLEASGRASRYRLHPGESRQGTREEGGAQKFPEMEL